MSTKDEKHYFKVTGETPGEYPHDSIDWGVPGSKLPKTMIVEVDGYYPDYTDAIRQKLREYALAKDPTQISEAGPFGFSFEEVDSPLPEVLSELYGKSDAILKKMKEGEDRIQSMLDKAKRAANFPETAIIGVR